MSFLPSDTVHMMNGLNLVEHLWLPVLATVAGGALLAALGTLLSGRARKAFWEPLGRRIASVSMLRVTTSGQLERLTNEVHSARADAARISGEAASEIVRLQRLLSEQETLHGSAIAEATRLAEAHVKADHDDAFAQGFAAGQAEAERKTAGERAVPLVQPNWVVVALSTDELYEIRNTQAGVVVTDLSISARVEEFQFRGATSWSAIIGDAVSFEGGRNRRGRSFGVAFTLRWRDARGDWREGSAWLDKEPPRIVAY